MLGLEVVVVLNPSPPRSNEVGGISLVERRDPGGGCDGLSPGCPAPLGGDGEIPGEETSQRRQQSRRAKNHRK